MHCFRTKTCPRWQKHQLEWKCNLNVPPITPVTTLGTIKSQLTINFSICLWTCSWDLDTCGKVCEQIHASDNLSNLTVKISASLHFATTSSIWKAFKNTLESKTTSCYRRVWARLLRKNLRAKNSFDTGIHKSVKSEAPMTIRNSFDPPGVVLLINH